jgi:hypothetical protein
VAHVGEAVDEEDDVGVPPGCCSFTTNLFSAPTLAS